MDAQRELLDQLMGKTRNLPDALKSKVREIHFSDKEVCKYQLAGLCPHNLFNATKSDIGRCPAEICGNSDALRAREQFLQLTQSERDAYGFEYELLMYLQELVRGCDQKIQKNKKRAEKEMAISEESLKKVSELDSQIRELTEKCVAAAEEGDIDLSQQISSDIDALKEEIEKITNPKDVKTTTVCEVSGNFMSMRDNDDRMRAHFEGKQFLGWKAVRDKLAELKVKNLKPPSKIIQSKAPRDRADVRAVVPSQRPADKDREPSFRTRDSNSVNEQLSTVCRDSSKDRNRDRLALATVTRSRSRERLDRVDKRLDGNGRHERVDRPDQRPDSHRVSRNDAQERTHRPEHPQQYAEPRRERGPPNAYASSDREGPPFHREYRDRDYPDRFDYASRNFDDRVRQDFEPPQRDSFIAHEPAPRKMRRSRSRSNERPKLKRTWEDDRREESRKAPVINNHSAQQRHASYPVHPVAQLKPSIEIKCPQRVVEVELEDGEEVEG